MYLKLVMVSSFEYFLIIILSYKIKSSNNMSIDVGRAHIVVYLGENYYLAVFFQFHLLKYKMFVNLNTKHSLVSMRIKSMFITIYISSALLKILRRVR